MRFGTDELGTDEIGTDGLVNLRLVKPSCARDEEPSKIEAAMNSTIQADRKKELQEKKKQKREDVALG